MVIILAEPPTPPSSMARSSVYLPIIGAPNPVADFCRFLVADPRQQRPSLELCPALQQAAEQRALGLASGEPFDHVDSKGITPNEHARLVGCTLPADYAEKGNEVESLVAGSADPAIVFNALANSSKHSDHLFGRGWLRAQRHFGVAMCAGGVYGWYWAIYIGTCTEQTCRG